MRTALRGVVWFAREFPLWILTSLRDVAQGTLGCVAVVVAAVVCLGALFAIGYSVMWLLFRP